MSKRNRPIEPECQIEDPSATAAVLDPPESGPPTEAELGQADDDQREAVAAIAAAIATSGETIAAQVNPVAPAAPDYTTIVANLDGQSAPAWPASSPFKVDWPWGGEPDPVPGDIVGWNWERGELAVVIAVPSATAPWPYTLTVEIRPMPEEWVGCHKVFDLSTGEQIQMVTWYTRWNRTYSVFDNSEEGDGGYGDGRVDQIGSGWLAVVQEKA